MRTLKAEDITFFLIRILIISIFSFYWLATILYCSPNNFIRIELNRYMNLFGSAFYQRWTFFTPPPKADEKLYFLFISKDPSQKNFACEVFNIIRAKKRANPIFDTESEALDGVITSSAYALNNSMGDRITVLRKTFPDSSELFFQKEMNSLFINPELRSTYFKTLQNYAFEIAKRYNLNIKGYSFKIRMITVELPPFKDRFNKKFKPKKKIAFETYPITI